MTKKLIILLNESSSMGKQVVEEAGSDSGRRGWERGKVMAKFEMD